MKPIRTKKCELCGIYKLVPHGNFCLSCGDKVKRAFTIAGYLFALILFLLIVTGCEMKGCDSGFYDYQQGSIATFTPTDEEVRIMSVNCYKNLVVRFNDGSEVRVLYEDVSY